jgi:protein TonB
LRAYKSWTDESGGICLRRSTRATLARQLKPQPTVTVAFRLNISVGDVVNVSFASREIVKMEEILQTQQLEKPPPPPRPPVEVEVEDTEPEIFVVVENPPEMIGGYGALTKDLKYPPLPKGPG